MTSIPTNPLNPKKRQRATLRTRSPRRNQRKTNNLD